MAKIEITSLLLYHEGESFELLYNTFPNHSDNLGLNLVLEPFIIWAKLSKVRNEMGWCKIIYRLNWYVKITEGLHCASVRTNLSAMLICPH